MKVIPLDDYEKDLEGFLNKGEYVSVDDKEESGRVLREAVKHHRELQKSKSVTLRVNQEDLIRVRAKAKANKIPYQTLISLLIHRYAKGESRINL